jgi:hypothetical protein
MPKKSVTKRRSAKNTLRLPDLDHSKNSVLQSLGSVASKRTYALAINDFIAWYCSEPRLAFGRPSYCGTATIWRTDDSPLPPST